MMIFKIIAKLPKPTKRPLNIKTTGYLKPKELEKRTALLERARAGDQMACMELRLTYHLTKIWNGKELVEL